MMLFEPFEFSGMRLKNQVVSVPVVSNLATEDGFVTDNLIDRASSPFLPQQKRRIKEKSE
ncbi:MAG: hypothetical protein A2169_04075 [Deltaproteobacteria bacterium RBG_13_47_9]|jgi:2,4-dienoyl-CoA reductase-like NADH-dependent reductase (Old Yellow Enzyme family)|nr:MAG: hypothetical protein A2169_04075 [Deltaproteobacteria bacterium RBG_13_47_9]